MDARNDPPTIPPRAPLLQLMLSDIEKITSVWKKNLVGALYSNMDWWWLASIFSKEQGIGSLQSRSWFKALSASSLAECQLWRKNFIYD